MTETKGGRPLALLDVTRWPTILVFVLAGTVAVIFAFTSVNLFSHAMANREFFQEFGWEAVKVGGLWQVVELIGAGAIALACWVVFKICEHTMEERYFAWVKRRSEGRSTQPRAEP